MTERNINQLRDLRAVALNQENSKTHISPRTFGFRQRVALFVGAGMTLGSAILAACGGGSEAKGPAIQPASPTATPTAAETVQPSTPSPEPKTPTRTPTERPTPSPTGTPEPTPIPELKKLSDAPVVPATIEVVKESIDLAFTKYPHIERGQKIDNNLQGCQFGDPTIPPGKEALRAADRAGACVTLIYVLYNDTYVVNRSAEFYQAMVNVRNYALTELPEQYQQQLLKNLQKLGIQ